MKYKASVLLFCILIHTCVILDAAVSKDAVSSSSAPQAAGYQVVAQGDKDVKAAAVTLESLQLEIAQLRRLLSEKDIELKAAREQIQWLNGKTYDAVNRYKAYLASKGAQGGLCDPNAKSAAQLEEENKKNKQHEIHRTIRQKVMGAQIRCNQNEAPINVRIFDIGLKEEQVVSVYPSDKAATILKQLEMGALPEHKPYPELLFKGKTADIDKTIHENGITDNTYITLGYPRK